MGRRLERDNLIPAAVDVHVLTASLSNLTKIQATLEGAMAGSIKIIERELLEVCSHCRDLSHLLP